MHAGSLSLSFPFTLPLNRRRKPASRVKTPAVKASRSKTSTGKFATAVHRMKYLMGDGMLAWATAGQMLPEHPQDRP